MAEKKKAAKKSAKKKVKLKDVSQKSGVSDDAAKNVKGGVNWKPSGS